MADMPIAVDRPGGRLLDQEYQRLLRGTFSSDREENVLFWVYSTALDEGRGDLFVALGLARALDARGWGVEFRNAEEWAELAPAETTVCVAMVQGANSLSLPPETVRIAWARNWVREWAASNTVQYDGMLASSEAARSFLAESFPGPTATLPIAADLDLFRDSGAARRYAVTTTLNYWGYERGLIESLREVRVPQGLHWFGHGAAEVAGLSPDVVAEGMIGYFGVANVYAQSRIVLDDMTPSTWEFGNQNSRLFESLAAGALVVVNCETGLEELGLGAVPVATTPAQLQETLDRYLGDEAARAELVDRLHARVLERHTYAHRAETFRVFVAEARSQLRQRYERVWAVEQAALQRELAEHKAGLEVLRQDLSHRDAQLVELQTQVRALRESRPVRLAHALGRIFGR